MHSQTHTELISRFSTMIKMMKDFGYRKATTQ